MDEKDIFDLLDGFYAYDTGCTDSGIYNNTKKEELKKYLKDDYDY